MAATELGPLGLEIKTAIEDITAFVEKCNAGGDIEIITQCLADYPEDVTTFIAAISRATTDLPEVLESLKSVVQSCDVKLAADVKELQELAESCA